jgi:hypothetical protein
MGKKTDYLSYSKQGNWRQEQLWNFTEEVRGISKQLKLLWAVGKTLHNVTTWLLLPSFSVVRLITMGHTAFPIVQKTVEVTWSRSQTEPEHHEPNHYMSLLPPPGQGEWRARAICPLMSCVWAHYQRLAEPSWNLVVPLAWPSVILALKLFQFTSWALKKDSLSFCIYSYSSTCKTRRWQGQWLDSQTVDSNSMSSKPGSTFY